MHLNDPLRRPALDGRLIFSLPTASNAGAATSILDAYTAFALANQNPNVHLRSDEALRGALTNKNMLLVHFDDGTDAAPRIVGAANLYRHKGIELGEAGDLDEIGSVQRAASFPGGFDLYNLSFAIHQLRKVLVQGAHAPLYCDVVETNHAVIQRVDDLDWQRFTPHGGLLAAKKQTVAHHDDPVGNAGKIFFLAPPRALVRAAMLVRDVLRAPERVNAKGDRMLFDLTALDLNIKTLDFIIEKRDYLNALLPDTGQPPSLAQLREIQRNLTFWLIEEGHKHPHGTPQVTLAHATPPMPAQQGATESLRILAR